MAWTKAKTVVVIGIVVILTAGTTVVISPRQSRPAIPAGAVSLNFVNVNAIQALELYGRLSGLKVIISPGVNRPDANIRLKADRISEAEAARLMQKALLEQAGIVITKDGNQATVTYDGSLMAKPAAPPPTMAIPPK